MKNSNVNLIRAKRMFTAIAFFFYVGLLLALIFLITNYPGSR